MSKNCCWFQSNGWWDRKMIIPLYKSNLNKFTAVKGVVALYTTKDIFSGLSENTWIHVHEQTKTYNFDHPRFCLKPVRKNVHKFLTQPCPHNSNFKIMFTQQMWTHAKRSLILVHNCSIFYKMLMLNQNSLFVITKVTTFRRFLHQLLQTEQ